MTTRRGYLRILLALAVLAFILPGQSSLGIAPAEEQTPPEVRRGLESALQSKAAALMNEKNEAGQPYKRGIYSKKFHKVDDSTYKVSFHVNTALTGEMTTERYMLTLTGQGADWKVTKEELQDTYTGLYRAVRPIASAGSSMPSRSSVRV